MEESRIIYNAEGSVSSRVKWEAISGSYATVLGLAEIPTTENPLVWCYVNTTSGRGFVLERLGDEASEVFKTSDLLPVAVRLT